MISQSKKLKILLFLPRLYADRGGGEQRPPLQLLALSRLLLDRYSIVIIDAAVEDNYKELVIQHCDGAICLGISCLLGYQIYDGADVAREVRKRFPGLPIVFGGWFPSVRPNIFLEEGIADVVVRGQGEKTFLEVVSSFVNGESLDGILGITYKKNGEIISNLDRPLIDLNDLPPIPYHLIDQERYIRSSSRDSSVIGSIRRWNSISKKIGRLKIDPDVEVRELHYFSSWGCPDSCKFCCSPGVTKRRWTALDPVRIVDEVEGLIKRYNFNFLIFCDANFGVSEKRVKGFCEELIKRDLKINWKALAEARSIAKYDKETLNLMNQSGCFAIFIGAESGCKETIALINKHIAPEETERSIDLLFNRGILPLVSYIIGFPGESSRGIKETLEQMCKLSLKYPEACIDIFIYFPLPGSAFHPIAVKLGYIDPERTDDWYNLNLRAKSNSSIPDNIEKEILRKALLLRDTYFHWGFKARWERPRLHIIGRLLEISARIRVRYRLFSFPLEFWLYNNLKKVYRRLRY